MSYEEDYPYLDFLPFSHGSHTKFYSKRIHPDYQLFDPTGHKKSHFVHECDVYKPEHRAWEEGNAICGRNTRDKGDLDLVLAKFVCKDCLKEMNKIMRRCLWDEMNEEYYDPMDEQ